MPLSLPGRTINTVGIIDDEPDARAAFQFPIEDMGLTARPEAGPLPDIEGFVGKILRSTDAAICDYRLRIRKYAGFDGAEAVAALLTRGVPAILYTRYQTADIDEIRVFRRHIPSLIRPDELSPDTIAEAFLRCTEEIAGTYRPDRRPWRTVVRIEEHDRERRVVYVVVPAWNSNEVVRILERSLPNQITDPGADRDRYIAQVNIGADSTESLYFDSWEV
jgi:hypothetical protein